MKLTVDHNTIRRGITLIVVCVIAFMAFGLLVQFTPVSAGAIFAAPLCGGGSAPDYGFTYALQQAHWTVDWQDYASEQAVTEVDAVLDRLNEDSIAQTMILIKSQAQVGNGVNCAVHFLRYMRLGQPAGERKDNGFVFLIVVEPTHINVHYAVGLGLPALTAPELTALNRAAEDAYQSTHSMDKTLLALVQGFDTVARGKYAPVISPAPTPETISLPPLPSGPLGILTIGGLLCVGIFFLVFLVWLLNQLARGGITSSPSRPSSSRGSGTGGPFGGDSSSSRGWESGVPLGRGRSNPPTRGGSGSGRSGRGN